MWCVWGRSLRHRAKRVSHTTGLEHSLHCSAALDSSEARGVLAAAPSAAPELRALVVGCALGAPAGRPRPPPQLRVHAPGRKGGAKESGRRRQRPDRRSRRGAAGCGRIAIFIWRKPLMRFSTFPGALAPFSDDHIRTCVHPLSCSSLAHSFIHAGHWRAAPSEAPLRRLRSPACGLGSSVPTATGTWISSLGLLDGWLP